MFNKFTVIRLLPSSMRRMQVRRLASKNGWNRWLDGLWEEIQDVIGAYETRPLDQLRENFDSFTEDLRPSPLRSRFNSTRLAIVTGAISLGAALTVVQSVATLYTPAAAVGKPELIAITLALGAFALNSLRSRSARSLISTALFALAGSAATTYGYLFVVNSLLPGAASQPFQPVLDPGLTLLLILAATGFVVSVVTFSAVAYITPRIVRDLDGSGDACRQIIAILYFLQTCPTPFYDRRDRTSLALTLERIATEVEFSISGHFPGLLALNPDVQYRMSGAAEQLRQMQTWAALPQQSTSDELSRMLLQYLCSIFTGRLHYLPFAKPRPRNVDAWRTVKRVTIGASLGAVPAIMTLAASSAGIVPAPWRETLTAVGGISLILGVATAVKPGSTKAIFDAQELLGKIGRGSPRQSDQAK